MQSGIEPRKWAAQEFGRAELGDVRRRARLVAMATDAATRPAGTVSAVFTSDARRQGAYDFLESPLFGAEALEQSLGASCAERSADEAFVFVPVDGTTLSLTDPKRQKGFGSVGGRHNACGRGLKLVTALAVDPKGNAVGVAAQECWARADRGRRTRRRQKNESRRRPRAESETTRWVNVIKSVAARFDSAHASAWFVLDREGDGERVLNVLVESGQLFTVRASHDRRVDDERVEMGWATKDSRRDKARLRAAMQKRPVMKRYELSIPAGPKRKARVATLTLRTHTLTLSMRISDSRRVQLLPMSVVWVTEERPPDGEAALDWMLLTNHRVDSFESAMLVVYGYAQRWRIEDMHKTWKSGLCDVESSQLRSVGAFRKWATVLLTVAVRAERLKHLARSEPDLPASVELTKHEVKALLLLKRREKKRTEEVPDATPSIAQATRWIAELGGYTGKSSGGPPGSITIGRGLQRVRAAAEALEQLERDKT